ncbi:MATE family efflux transporter [Roseimarinus sediminis]|uniref:MATE family efflux transporter n=1 Tax=Roseimarinus sediminis TaxID=1610899 RepID=UPI003D1949BD
MNKKILRLAIPNIVSNITVPLLGLADMALMGHMGNPVYIGAIALGGVLFNIIYWSFAFLRMGTSGFTAQAYGESNQAAAITTLARALFVALIASLLVIALQVPIEWLSFELIQGSNEVEALAASYFRIRIWAAPATISIFALTGWFLGMQNARIPMYVAILVNLINLGANFLFIFAFGMKSDGVALGTVVAQYSGLLFSLLMLKRHYGNLLPLIRRKALFELESMTQFFKVNSDIFIRTLCIIAVFTFFTSRSAASNDTLLAVNSLLLQFLMFYSYFIDGFAYAGEALVGKYVGARKPDQLKKVIRYLFIWGSVLTFLYSIVYLTANENIIRLLTNSREVIEASIPYLPWVVAIPIVGTASYLWDGIYIGATASKGMLYSMLGATFLVFFPVYFIMNQQLGNHALWLAMILFMGSRGLFQTLLARKYVFRKYFG